MNASQPPTEDDNDDDTHISLLFLSACVCVRARACFSFFFFFFFFFFAFTGRKDDRCSIDRSNARVVVILKRVVSRLSNEISRRERERTLSLVSNKKSKISSIFQISHDDSAFFFVFFDTKKVTEKNGVVVSPPKVKKVTEKRVTGIPVHSSKRQRSPLKRVFIFRLFVETTKKTKKTKTTETRVSGFFVSSSSGVLHFFLFFTYIR